MKYIHPDIVVGEPISEVEPRVNQEVLEYAVKSIRFCRWAGLLLVLLIVLFTALRVPWSVRIGTLAVGFVVVIGWAMRPGTRAKRKKQWKNKNDVWSIPFRTNFKFQAYTLLLMMLVQMLFVFSGDGVSGNGNFVGIMAVVFGVGLVWVSRHIREPGQISCVDCEYPLVGLTIPCECPECGRMIYDPSWTTDRPRVRSGWFVPAGVIVAVFGGLIIYSGIANPGLMYGPMPRGVLMQLAPTDKGAFNQLILRPMDQSQTDELIERLIAGNEGKGGWDYNTNDQQQWLGQFAGTGRISRDQYERMFGRVTDWVRIELVKSPENKTVQVGKEAEVRLVSTRYIRLPDSGVIVRYFFNGFEIGDDAELVGGVSGEKYLSFLNAKVGDGSYQYIPRGSFTPTQSGPLVIRARVVVVMHAVRSGMPIRWDDPDGLFETEPDWWTVIDLEHTIEVQP